MCISFIKIPPWEHGEKWFTHSLTHWLPDSLTLPLLWVSDATQKQPYHYSYTQSNSPRMKIIHPFWTPAAQHYHYSLIHSNSTRMKKVKPWLENENSFIYSKTLEAPNQKMRKNQPSPFSVDMLITNNHKQRSWYHHAQDTSAT